MTGERRLLERDDLLSELNTMLGEVESGSGRLALIGGESGSGKTALVREFASRAAAKADVLTGSCDPVLAPRPLGPILDMMDQLPDTVGRHLAAKGRDGLFSVLRSALMHSDRPQVLTMEDVHWGDEVTFDLVRYLGRRLNGIKALIIVTYRDDEIGWQHPFRLVLGDIAPVQGASRLKVPSLSPAAVATLCEGSGIDPEELHRVTGGNAFFVTEVLGSGQLGVPATVRDAVLARAARLSDTGRTALEAAAVIGQRIDLDLLDRVHESGERGVGEAIERGLLISRGHYLEFRHELAREAIRDEIPNPRARTLHRRLLAHLMDDDVRSRDLVRIAHHAYGAGDDETLLAIAPKAARRAAALGAHREAATLYERAVERGEGLSPGKRATLLEALGLELAVTDRGADSLLRLRDSLAIWESLGDEKRVGRALSLIARVLVTGFGANAEADKTIQEALTILEPLGRSRELGVAYYDFARLRMLDRENDEAIEWGERAIELGNEFADKETVINAHNVVGSALLLAGDSKGRTYLQRSKELATEAGMDQHVANAVLNLGSALGELYELEDAIAYLSDGVQYSLDRDLDSHRLYMLAWLGLCHLYQGGWQLAGEYAGQVLREPEISAISRIMALIALGRLRTRRGDPGNREALDEALEIALPTNTLQRLGPVRAARAEAAWLEGDLESTGEEARAAFTLAERAQHPWHLGELTYWRRLAGDRVPLPENVAMPWQLQISGRLKQAADAWLALGCPYEAARALSEIDDEESLRDALSTFDELGAQPMAARVSRKLREMGTRVPRGPRPSTRANPAGLTARELEILLLVAEGLRNSDIAERLSLSTRTVDHHVAAVLRKLDVKNRAEAAIAGIRLGLVPENGQSIAET